MSIRELLENEKKNEKTRGVGFSTNDSTEKMLVELVDKYKENLPGLNRSKMLRVLVLDAYEALSR